MGEPFERSNQATAGSPRIGKGSPREISGWVSFCQPLLTESTAQNRIVSVRAPRRWPSHARPLRLHNVEKKAGEGLFGEGIPFSLCLPDDSDQGPQRIERRDDVIICGLFSLGSSYLLQPSHFGLLV